MLLLPPPLAEVLDASRNAAAGQASAETLQAALPAAFRFVWNGARLLDQLAPSLLRTGRVPGLLTSGRQEVEAQWMALEAVGKALGEGRITGAQRAADDLRAATERLQETLRALQTEELEGGSFSPYPEIDRFLKIGRNVLDGHTPSEALQATYLATASIVGRLRAATQRFACLYAEPALVARAEPALDRMEAGMGAAAEFLRDGLRLTLEDALRLLGPASVDVHEAMAGMEAAAAAQRQYARHPLAEDLFRARERHLPEEACQQLWAETALALEGEAARAAALQAHPLRLLADLEVEAPARLLERAGAALEQARGAGLAAADLAGLDAALQDLREALAGQAELLERAQGPFRGAPLLEELQILVGRAMLGHLPAGELQPVLDHFRALQGGLANELQDSAGLMDPGEEGVLQHLLLRQAGACDLLAAWCRDGEVQHLRDGWAVLAESAPRLVELSQVMRDRLQDAAGPATGTPCVRCGASNPRETRYCRHCSAVLPVSAQGPTVYSDITGGGPAPEATPAHVVRLESLVRQVEAGEAGPEEVASTVDDLLARADRVAQGFQQQILPRAQQDPTVQEYARFFRDQMDLYLEGLHTFRHFAEDGESHHLHRGLEACRAAGAELMALRATVEAAVHP